MQPGLAVAPASSPAPGPSVPCSPRPLSPRASRLPVSCYEPALHVDVVSSKNSSSSPVSPLAWPPCSPEGLAWPWTWCPSILSHCQPASVFTGPCSFLGSLLGVRRLALSGLVSGARGIGCVRVWDGSCRAHTARNPVGSFVLPRSWPAPCVSGIVAFQVVPPPSLCWDTLAPRRVHRLLKPLLAVPLVSATPHPACEPPSALYGLCPTCNTPVLCHTCCPPGASRPRTARHATRPSAAVRGHVIRDAVGCSRTSASFYFCWWKDSVHACLLSTGEKAHRAPFLAGSYKMLLKFAAFALLAK